MERCNLTNRYLKCFNEVYAASQQELAAHPDLREIYARLEDFTCLAAWACVPPLSKHEKPVPDSERGKQQPDFEDDLGHALFYAKAGLYDDAFERLQRFVRFSLSESAAFNGAKLDRYCDEQESLKVLLAEKEFRKFDKALRVRSRLKEWLAVMEESPHETATCCIVYLKSRFKKFILCAHEAVDLAIISFVYRNPMIMVALDGTEKFGDFTRWASLLEGCEVGAVHSVLKPKSLKYLRGVCVAHPVITAMRAYLRDAAPVNAEEEFSPRFTEMMEYISGVVGAEKQ
jgi:hypothetical protein